MIQARFRSIAVWPYPVTRDRRYAPFRAGWQKTLNDLDREIGYLKGRDVIIGAGFSAGDIRLDGWPRADARAPGHPGVELSFTAGTLADRRLIYASDVCRSWEDNVRAIYLGLEALRAVDRHGITRRGEQYAGFAALPAGIPLGEALTEESAWGVLEAAAGHLITPTMRGDIAFIRSIYRVALKKTHPDTGGGALAFQKVVDAGRILGVAS